MKNKGNDGKGNITERDDWETPKWLFKLLNENYSFEFDCCATKENTICIKFSTRLELEPKNNFICWMNPPFSKAKEMFKHFFRISKKGVAIYRCDNMETKVYQEIILKKADWIFIPKGRITYSYNEKLRKGKGTRFPSALIGFNIKPITNIEGITLFLK